MTPNYRMCNHSNHTILLLVNAFTGEESLTESEVACQEVLELWVRGLGHGSKPLQLVLCHLVDIYRECFLLEYWEEGREKGREEREVWEGGKN